MSGLGGAKVPLNTPGGVTIPKLNIGGKEIRDKSGTKHKRQLSDSSRGSIGRKERLRNALTGSTDGRGDGADKPKELPKSELIDFLLQYDRTDPFCYKLVKKRVPRSLNDDYDPDDEETKLSGKGSINSNTNLSDEKKDDQKSNSQAGYEGGSDDNKDKSPAKKEKEKKEEAFVPHGDSSSSNGDSQYKIVEEVQYPSLDEALDMKFDLNNSTNIQQRLRNLNCQPRDMKELYPAPFHLLTKREKRCKDCQKFVIKPNINPTSNEKMKADFQMVYFVPKVMIYRTGKYTPYKGKF